MKIEIWLSGPANLPEASDAGPYAESRLSPGGTILIFLIRTWGNYPDAVAFSVLLMNFAAPFLDYYTQPKTYGHGGNEG